MQKPLLVFEDIFNSPRRKLFEFAGIAVVATPLAWMSPFFFCLIGLAIAVAGHSGEPLTTKLLYGIAYGLMLSTSNVIHSLGHVFSGKLVGATMDVLLLTSTRDVTLYTADQSRHTKWVFIGRSLGGPVSNLVIASIGFSLWKLTDRGWLRMFAFFNFVIGLWTLIPILSMDGWVIWGELFGFRRRS